MSRSSMLYFFTLFTFSVLVYATFPRDNDKVDTGNNACLEYQGDSDFSCSPIKLPPFRDTIDLPQDLENNSREVSNMFTGINISIDDRFDKTSFHYPRVCKPHHICYFGALNDE